MRKVILFAKTKGLATRWHAKYRVLPRTWKTPSY